MKINTVKATIFSALGGVVFWAANAGAATVVVGDYLDLTKSLYDIKGIITNSAADFSPPFSVDISAGDTVDYTMMFAGNRPVLARHIEIVQPLLVSEGGGYAGDNSTGTLSFLNSKGIAIFTTTVSTDTSCCGVVGENFTGAALNGLPTGIRFYGVRYQGTLNNYDQGTTHTFQTSSFYFVAKYVSIGGLLGSAAAAPEPRTWTMIGLGFFGLGAALRARSRKFAQRCSKAA